MKFRLIFSALAIIVALGAYALKGGFSGGNEEAPQQAAQPQATQQATPAPASNDSMSGFSINNKN